MKDFSGWLERWDWQEGQNFIWEWKKSLKASVRFRGLSSD